MNGAIEPQQQFHARLLASLEAAMEPVLLYLTDETVIEIMCNDDGRVWVERAKHGIAATDLTLSPGAVERMLRNIAGALEFELNASSPSLSCKLPVWGARVQGGIPPAVAAPVFAFRRPARDVISLENYIASGVVTPAQADVLRAAIEDHSNVLVSGGTGSGKTTFINALLELVSQSDDRVLIIEDTPELQCVSANKLQLFVQPSGYTWQHAVKDAMRYRPDRIIVGEVRDGAALELVKAWGTGHPGGLATIHANSSRGSLERVCQLIQEVAPVAPRELVAETIQVCVHIRRDRSHRAGRSISSIDRVVGYSPSEGFRVEPLVAA